MNRQKFLAHLEELRPYGLSQDVIDSVMLAYDEKVYQDSETEVLSAG